MGALGQALACQGAEKMHCIALGSVKSCYGHTEGAAGLTGALLALQATRSQVCLPRLTLVHVLSLLRHGAYEHAHFLSFSVPWLLSLTNALV